MTKPPEIFDLGLITSHICATPKVEFYCKQPWQI